MIRARVPGRFSVIYLFVASTLGIITWLTVNWLLEPKPFTITIPDYLPPKEYLDSNQLSLRISDSQGFWTAECYDGTSTRSRWKWIVHNLKTGQAQEQALHTHSYSPYVMTSGVPILGGYRHFRFTADNRYEVIDTQFSDGSSTLRLRLPPDTLMPRCLRDHPFLFNRDGSRLTSFHPFPQSYLRFLGNINCVPWDVLAVEHLRTLMELKYDYISFDSLLVQVWDVEAAKVVHSMMLPALTNLFEVQRSPSGRWLVRAETGILPERWFFPSNSTPSETLTPLHAALPRGVFVLDCNTGNALHLAVTTKNDQEGAFVVEAYDAGIYFCPVTEQSTSFGGRSVDRPANNDQIGCFYQLPGGKNIPKRSDFNLKRPKHLSLVRTVDGTDVTYLPVNDAVSVVRVSIEQNGFGASSRPLEICDYLYDILPTNQPGQIYVNWLWQTWPNWLANWCSKIGLDLNQHFPLDSACCTLVDVDAGKIIWEHHTKNATQGPLKDQQAYSLSHDGSAILLRQQKDRELTLTRWDLPLALWSPCWGRAAGLIAAVLLWLLMTKVSSRHAQRALQRSR